MFQTCQKFSRIDLQLGKNKTSLKSIKLDFPNLIHWTTLHRSPREEKLIWQKRIIDFLYWNQYKAQSPLQNRESITPNIYLWSLPWTSVRCFVTLNFFPTKRKAEKLWHKARCFSVGTWNHDKCVSGIIISSKMLHEIRCFMHFFRYFVHAFLSLNK